MTDPGASVLATFYQHYGSVESSTVYGAGVATLGMLAALVRHGTYDRYRAYVPPDGVEATSRHLEQLGGNPTEAVAWTDLPLEPSDLGISVWHELALIPRAPFHLRSTYSNAMFPISLVHHTISYPSLTHEVFLPLLLADTQPCDSVVCTSTAARTAIRNLLDHVAERFNAEYGTRLSYRGRLDHIPLGIDTETMRPRDKADSRRLLGLPEEPLIIMWFGRISALDKADLMPLIQVFTDVRAYTGALRGGEPRPMMLLLVGSDPRGQEAALRREARAAGVGEHVEVRTGVDGPQRHLYFGAADIMIAPTDNVQEAFGLAPVEAMSCGVPQIAAEWDGYRDTIAHGETGFLVPTLWGAWEEDLATASPLFAHRGLWDQGELAQAVALDPVILRRNLLELVENDDLRKRMSVASRARAEAEYAWPVVVRRYEELWSELRATADELEPPAGPRDSYLRMPYREAFGHYPTTLVDEDRLVHRSPLGTTALEDDRSLAPDYGGMDADELRTILEAIDEEPVSIRELIDRLGAGRTYDGVIGRRVMRLVKYGYVHFA